MKKLVLLCALAGLPLAAFADDMQGMGGPGMGMQGQGMGGMGGMGGGMQGGEGMGQGGGMGMQGQGMGQGGGHRPPGPPPEFLQACQGKREGDAVNVNTPRGTLQGTCRLTFHPSQRPDGGQQGQQPGQGQQQGQQGQGRTPGARPPIR